MPAGWTEEYTLDFQRGETALDPTRLILNATWLSKGELYDLLLSWLEVDSGVESVATAELGSFTWDFYELQVGAHPVDMALAEEGGTAYFVLLFSPRDERDTLYEQVFLPVVEALVPVE